MTDDTPTADDAQEALDTLREYREDVLDGVTDASENVDGVRHSLHDLTEELEAAAKHIEEAKQIAQAAQSGGDPMSNLDDAYTALDRPFVLLSSDMKDLLDAVEDGLDAED